MPAGKFNPQLDVAPDGTVMAGGPLDQPKDEVIEMCVWVYQRVGDNDAIANGMSRGPGFPEKMDMGGNMGLTDVPITLAIAKDANGNNKSWSLELEDRMEKKADFVAGSATAVAIGVFQDETGNETAFLWSEPVRLNLLAATAP